MIMMDVDRLMRKIDKNADTFLWLWVYYMRCRIIFMKENTRNLILLLKGQKSDLRLRKVEICLETSAFRQITFRVLEAFKCNLFAFAAIKSKWSFFNLIAVKKKKEGNDEQRNNIEFHSLLFQVRNDIQVLCQHEFYFLKNVFIGK